MNQEKIDEINRVWNRVIHILMQDTADDEDLDVLGVLLHEYVVSRVNKYMAKFRFSQN